MLDNVWLTVASYFGTDFKMSFFPWLAWTVSKIGGNSSQEPQVFGINNNGQLLITVLNWYLHCNTWLLRETRNWQVSKDWWVMLKDVAHYYTHLKSGMLLLCCIVQFLWTIYTGWKWSVCNSFIQVSLEAVNELKETVNSFVIKMLH